MQYFKSEQLEFNWLAYHMPDNLMDWARIHGFAVIESPAMLSYPYREIQVGVISSHMNRLEQAHKALPGDFKYNRRVQVEIAGRKWCICFLRNERQYLAGHRFHYILTDEPPENQGDLQFYLHFP